MEGKISTTLANSGQKLIHSIQVKLRVGPVKSERIAVFSNTYFSIFQKNECKKSFLWIELSSINATDKDVTLKFGKNAFRIFPSDLKQFLSCIFDVIQRVLLPSELEKLNFELFRSFVALPNPFSCSSRIRMKIEESKIEYDRSLVQSITDMLSYPRKELDLSMFDSALIPLIMDAIPLYYGIRSIKISSSGKVDAYHYVSELALEKTNLRLIDVQGYSNSNFDKYIENLSLNKSPKLLSLSFESSFFQAPQLNSIKNLYKKSSLKGIEFHDAIAPQAFDFFHDSFFLSLNLKSLNLDRTRGLNLPRIFILVPDLVLLSLEGCDLDISDVIIQIQKLTKLRSINLSGNRCTNSAKLRTPLPDNVLSVYVNNVTWEKQCLVEFFKYRVMKLSISYISTTTDEWERLFDSLPENQNNTLASIIWDGNNLHSNFFNYLKNQICMNYLSLNDCFSQSHPECLSYLIDYLRYKDLALTEFSLRGTETNHIGEYLPNILNTIFNSTKITTIDVYGQRGGDQSLLTIKENIGNVKVVSCDKMNPTKGAILFDLADKATSYQVWLSYPSDDIISLVHSNRLTASESRTLYNKFRMLPKRIQKQPPRVLYPPPSSSAFDLPFQVYKYMPQNDFPRYLKEKQLRLYEKAPPMSKVAPSITLPNGQKQVVMSPQSSPQQQPQVSFQSPQTPPKQQITQTKTISIQQDAQIQTSFVDNADPTLTLGSPSNYQINQGSPISVNKVNQVSQQYAYNRQSPSNSKQNQQFSSSPKVFQNYSRGSPPSSKNRSKTGSSSPTSIYKEMSRPPPPRFIFEDDPITLEMSRDDETILPTIDEEFYPYNNNGISKTANNYYYNNNYNNNNYENNLSKTTNQRQIQASNQAPSRNRSRTNPSRNERAASRNQRKNQRPEEEDFDDGRYDDDNNNVKRNTRRRHYEDDDLDNENMRRQTKSRSRGRNEVHRSTSRQHQNHRHRNNNDDEYDDENEYFERQPEYDDEFEENEEEIDNSRRRNRNTNRNRRKNSPRNVPITERSKRERHRLNYEDELENENYDYDDDENEFKNQSRRRRTTAAPVKSRTQRPTQQTSKTPSPYNRPKQSSSHRPNQRQSQQIQHQQQKQQSQSQRQHRRNEAARQRQRVPSRNANYNYNDDGEDYDENEYNDNNYSEDNFVERKPKVQSQRRSRNVQQQRPKQQRKSQSHRPRVQKLQNNDYDDYNDDYDDDQDDNENEEFNRQSRSRQHRRQIQNQIQQERKHIQHRAPTAPSPERIHETQRRQKTERNHVISNRQQTHSKSRSRTNKQRMNNYNKDFDENNNGYDDDDYDNDFENNFDDSQSYSVKRKENSQKNPSRNHSKKQYSENVHTHKIVRNINHDISPKPSRRPAPKYVKDLSFSSAYSYE